MSTENVLNLNYSKIVIVYFIMVFSVHAVVTLQKLLKVLFSRAFYVRTLKPCTAQTIVYRSNVAFENTLNEKQKSNIN